MNFIRINCAFISSRANRIAIYQQDSRKGIASGEGGGKSKVQSMPKRASDRITQIFLLLPVGFHSRLNISF